MEKETTRTSAEDMRRKDAPYLAAQVGQSAWATTTTCLLEQAGALELHLPPPAGVAVVTTAALADGVLLSDMDLLWPVAATASAASNTSRASR